MFLPWKSGELAKPPKTATIDFRCDAQASFPGHVYCLPDPKIEDYTIYTAGITA